MDVFLYTSNQHKLSELTALFSDLSVTLLSAKDLSVNVGVAETGATFIENALIKARDGCAQSQMPCLADDSGLLVDSIKEPGLYSARYAGERATDSENIEKLLDKLNGYPAESRQAAFYCCMVYLKSVDDPMPLVAEATWQGTILQEKKGDNGFGYDPIFYLPNLDKTAAELSPQEKMKLSHRGQAAKLMKRKLSVHLG